MVSRVSFFFLILLSLSFKAWAEPTLKVGDQAPPLKAEQWLQGGSIDRFKPGQVYIVEFWATWCGPCVDSIKYLNYLKEKYGNRLTIIGVAADQGQETDVALKEIWDFLGKRRPSINYHVAYDGKNGQMKANWMEAAKQEGIPSSFVVDGNGKIAWIGHPTELELAKHGNPLELVLNGKWFGSAGYKKYREELKDHEIYTSLIESIHEARKAQDWQELYNIATGGTALPEPHRSIFVEQQASMLIEHLDRPEAGVELILPLIFKKWDHVQALGNYLELLFHNNVPAGLVNPERGELIAQRVIELIDDNPDLSLREKFQYFRWLLVPPVAEFYYKIGRYDLAVEHQTHALNSAGTEVRAKNPELEANLARYRVALAQQILFPPIVLKMVCTNGVCSVPTGEHPADCPGHLADKGK